MSSLLCPSVLVPNSIVEGKLSSEALAAMTWVIAENNIMVDVSRVRERFNWGTHIWQRVSKELRDSKLMTLKSGTGGNRLYLKGDLITC